ncbi:TonB-dependent receptor [Arenibacter sp. BSSL-BM3]|uniref:TonB-dependent receptor n=1 Tax=Arenibacter arenosicollis TaxID=2762274 RepID=A0ABR7QKN2_9FLAO|nr:TonB-dependent receptor plug domain-containing protein [Arenibacter arenosicollis]MBC8767740.1 TonB-dependent receptor [Arenibacter arenosicollis]
MKLFAFKFVLLASTCIIYGQTGLKGRIVDEKGNGLSDVNIYLQIFNTGTNSNPEGYFELELENGNYAVIFSSIGYSRKILNVSIHNEMKNLGEIILISLYEIMDEAVVSGSRRLEKITQAPASINLINARQLENIVGSPEELFALQKGVDFTRIGNFWGAISIRGFNSSFNQKMLILDDNRIAHTRIRTPVGPMSAFVKEDIERVEIVLGPSSALYGPNCLNGLFNTISKSPFKYRGTDVILGTGSNELYTARLRHAKVLNNKWAYKITSEYISGREAEFTDSIYVATSTPGEFLGKKEVGVDRNVSFVKGLASIFHRPSEDSEIGLTYALNLNNSISVGGAGRNNLKDWNNSSLQATYKSPHWFVQFYNTWIILDNSTNVLARTKNYYMLINQGLSESEAFVNSKKGPQAASIEEDSYRNNAELQYNNTLGNTNFVIGAQYQKENAFSNHTYLLDEDGPIELNQLGIYGQLIYDLNETGLKLLFTARGDRHSLYGNNFLPKAGITYTKNEGTWRITFGEGYTAPTLINTHLTLAGGIVLGNSDGFTLSDGSKIDPIRPETIRTLELGYKRIVFDCKLFMDLDVYYNWSEDMIGPIFNIAPQGTSGGPVVTHRGNRPITDFTQGIAPGMLDPGAVINTNINFGEVRTYGFDFGLNYYFSNNYNLSLNYSYFDYSLDKHNLKNDGNFDGKVTDNDLSVNTPKNKLSAAFNTHNNKFYATLFARWVQKYDFFSGRNVAAKTNINNIYNGSPVIEGQRVGDQWNYGPLGGFYLSANGNYQLSKTLNLGVYVNNIIGKGNYEFVVTAPTETTFGLEIKLSLLNE